MGFPNDVSDVVVFKIHPAIGVARLSRNDDHYVYGEGPQAYKSGGRIKRQAVQFRIFAYAENHVGLGELTERVMKDLKIKAVWSARVANRKVAKRKGTPPSGTALVIAAEASSDDDNDGQLVGSLAGFAEGAKIPLGQITSTGLFIPPKSRAFRKVAGQELPDFPGNADFADNSSDGSVCVTLTKGRKALPVLPACIVVCPQDFSPETSERTSLVDFFKRVLQIPDTTPPANLHNQAARFLDEAALKSSTERFAPGVEVCLGGGSTEVADVKSICYQNSQDPTIDPREARIRYKPSPDDTGPGAVPGQLTSGLCSPWQSDYIACTHFWVEHLPTESFLDEETSTKVQTFRKKYKDTSDGAEIIVSGDEFDQHLDEIGVVRLQRGKKVETERGPGDDIADLTA